MKSRIPFGILTVSALAGCVLPASAAPISPAETAQLLETIRAKHDLPALAVVVVLGGQICDRAAVGVRKLGEPTKVTTDDVFHIGSCTKAMTATLTAMLIDAGTLRWQTTIADVFPDLKGKIDKRYESVTVEQLLAHRAGVPSAPPAAAWKRAWEQKGTPTQQRREFIEAVLSQPPVAAPNSKLIYSNQGYAIVGAMLEKLTGAAWETLITERLFKPLHMNSAGFGPPGTIGAVDQPWGHVRELNKTVPVQSDNPPAIAPAACVHCSLDDLARFTMLHMEHSQPEGLLKSATREMLHLAAGVDNYAFGWLVLERIWAGGYALVHNGSNSMWYTVMWVAPKRDFSVVVSTNVGGQAATKACDEVASAMVHQWLLK